VTTAEWRTAIASALAARERLRRAHNAMGATVRDGKGGIHPNRKAKWNRYRAQEFLPASRRIEARICELREEFLPAGLKTAARDIVKGGKLTLPAGAAWRERVALLEAATVVFAPEDAQTRIIVPASCAEAAAPPQEALDAADISPGGAKAMLAPDPTEDFTGYTEVDPNDRYAVAASAVTVTALQRNEDAYVYKDRGTGHFDGFSHNVDYKNTATSAYSLLIFWALANVVNDAKAWDNANAEVILCNAYGNSPTLYIRNEETGTQSGQTVSNNTQYYNTISRESGGTTVTMYVYSNPSRTTLVGSKSVSVTGSRKYRFIFAANSYNDGKTYTVSAVIANLDLGEAAGIIPIVMHHLTKNIKAG